MAVPNAQWKLNNQAEIEKLFPDFVVQFERSGDHLLLTGPMGMEIELEPGDCLMVDGERVGVVRVPVEAKAEKLEVYGAVCENCGKQVQVKISVLQDPSTLMIVCTESCRESLEFRLRMNGDLPQ